MITSIISGVLGVGGKLIDKLFPDPTEAARARLALAEMEQKGELKEMETQMQAIVAEANSTHWLAANWRPITMLTFVFIVFNNYILYPYLGLFWHDAPKLDIPPDLWGLIKIGLGGYVVGRSCEKVAAVVKK